MRKCAKDLRLNSRVLSLLIEILVFGRSDMPSSMGQTQAHLFSVGSKSVHTWTAFGAIVAILAQRTLLCSVRSRASFPA